MPDDSPVAHEGNPTETPPLVIEGGNLLTTATLGIVSPVSDISPVLIPPQTETPPVPCSFQEEFRAVTNCASGNVTDRYDAGSYWPLAKLNGDYPNCGAQGAVSFFPTPPFDIEVVSSDNTASPVHGTQGNFAGFTLFSGIPSASHSTVENQVGAIFRLVSGSPRSGFCFFVDPTSTPCNFTGMVAIVDWRDGISFVGYYVNADLHTVQPTMIGSPGVLPTTGEGVYLFACSTCFPATNDIEFYTDHHFPNVRIPSLAAVVPTVPITPTQSMGIIWLPNAQGTVLAHRSNWEYGFFDWGVI